MPRLECGPHGLKADPSARADDQDCRHGVILPVGPAWLIVMACFYSLANHAFSCNLKFPSGQLVRASTSAPTYFPQRLGRPKIDSATEWKVRKRLANGIGILKVAKSLGIGTGTVQRIANELR